MIKPWFAAVVLLGLIPASATAQARLPNASSSAVPYSPIDSITDFLLTSAASDFHAHRPPDPARFRDVHIGHIRMIPGGPLQYVLCGEFLPAQSEGKPKWTPFATIKTSGYEQYLGAQATAFCRNQPILWDNLGDLTVPLKARLDSLR